MLDLRKIKHALRSFERMIRQTRNPNYIGFDKYRLHGAYHWGMLKTDDDYRNKIDLLERHISEGDSVVDLGCGDGAYAYSLCQKCRLVVGLDADYDAVQLANEKLAEQGVSNCYCLQLPLSKATLKTLRVEKPFDVAYSMDVIEHLPNPAELLEVSVRLVKMQGAIVIGTPLFLRNDLVSPYHVKEYTIEEIRDLLSQYMTIREEAVVPLRRLDKNIYDEGFYIGVGTPHYSVSV